ncbi:unnamed protein product [Brachionus calyciflorus]|uniref:Uncharacterized protein n=1 Tax=Brachionus calyciflorus TaxID=104777 RepID=A0A814PNA7_9BILA|nr:unnamed protein product [Brachionus calyciflorus]
MVKNINNLPSLFSKQNSITSDKTLTNSVDSPPPPIKSPQISPTYSSSDRKISNASILTTSTVSSNSSTDSSYLKSPPPPPNTIKEYIEAPKMPCTHRHSFGSIDVSSLVNKNHLVGLLDKADQSNRIKNQFLRKHKSSCQLLSPSNSTLLPDLKQNGSNIKIIMNSDDEDSVSKKQKNSLNKSQLEMKLQANASSLLKLESNYTRQYRSNSCSGGSICLTRPTFNNHLSVPEQTLNYSIIKNRKSSASSILDKANRYELESLARIEPVKFCSNCCLVESDYPCKFYLNENNQSTSNSVNSNNCSSNNIYFEFISSAESLPNNDNINNNSKVYSFKSHLLSGDTSSGINLTKSAADILLENVDFERNNFQNDFPNQKFRKMVSFLI